MNKSLAEIVSIPRPVSSESHVFLIDASGFIFRAYHALPPLTRKSDNLPVGAIAGFCNMVWKLLQDMQTARNAPTHLACIFDHSGHSFRNRLYPQYKAHRPPAPEDLVPQFPLVRNAAQAFGLPVIEMPDFEADDLIATYARMAEALGATTTIVSSDKDLMQLVGETISLFDTMKGKRIGPEQVVEKFGVDPDLVIDVQALAGDSSDNVPGIPGIGPKIAAQLITQFGSLDALLEGAKTVPQKGRREKLLAHAEDARISRELVTLRTDVPVSFALEDMGLELPDQSRMLGFFEEMEFRTLTRRVRDAAGHEATTEAGDTTQGTAAQAIIDPSAYVCISDMETLNDWIARATAQGFVAVDTETDSLRPVGCQLVGISLALAPNEACYIPLGHRGQDLLAEPIFEQIPLKEALAGLKPILEDPSVLKIGHNIKFDLSVLSNHAIDVTPIDDTMLLSFVLAAGQHGHGMDELSERLLGHTPVSFKTIAGSGKAQITFDRVAIPEATHYAAEDADITLRLWHILKPQLIKQRATSLYETIERPLVPVIAQMEQAGILIDQAALKALSDNFAKRMGELETQAHAEAGCSFNLASPGQLGEILYGQLGLPGGKKTKTGAWSTRAGALEDLATQGHALPQTLLDWRTLAKLKSTYTDALAKAAHPETGRVHTSFSMAGAQTGRLSSTDPNLQNIPVRNEEGRKIRKAFIAAPGHVLVSADYSQIELRLLAHIAEIDTLREAFRQGHDIHAMTASEMFGVPLQDMDPQTRRQAKAINFGIIYGISAFGLARQLSISRSEADHYIRAYLQKFPGIAQYMETAKAFARDKGYVETAFGRRCHVPAIHTGKGPERAFAERQAINAPIQGSAADIIKRAMIRMPHALSQAGLKARMLLQVHDELLFEAPEGEAEALIALAQNVMQTAALPAQDISVPLIVEARAAQNWAEAH